MTNLEQAVADYLAVRRAMGFKLEGVEWHLRRFAAYQREHDRETITVTDAIEWARLPADAHPGYWAIRLCAVRGFAAWLQLTDPTVGVPPTDVLPHFPLRATPFIYTDGQITALIEQASRLAVPLRATTYRTLIALLAVTGMRIGEAIRLDDDDVDLEHEVVVVRDSKFGKSRELPLHPTTTDALRGYLNERRRLFPKPLAPALFITLAGTRLLPGGVQSTFRSLIRAAGIRPRSANCRPRIHDIRHRFAVLTVEDCYRDGLDPSTRLPLLSTYLGHVNPGATYWYLTATPELLGHVAQRLESGTEDRS